MKGFFVCPKSLPDKRNKYIPKSCEGTSSGSLAHPESERLLESSYAHPVKKAPKLREEITTRESKTLPASPRDRASTDTRLYAEVHVVRHGRTKVVPRELDRSSSLQGDEGRFFTRKT